VWEVYIHRLAWATGCVLEYKLIRVWKEKNVTNGPSIHWRGCEGSGIGQRTAARYGGNLVDTVACEENVMSYASVCEVGLGEPASRSRGELGEVKRN
jgi:hypothetical protein